MLCRRAGAACHGLHQARDNGWHRLLEQRALPLPALTTCITTIVRSGDSETVERLEKDSQRRWAIGSCELCKQQLPRRHLCGRRRSALDCMPRQQHRAQPREVYPC
jgi:hypothetical protein